MLGKLLKYDIKSMGRILFPLYVAALAFSLIVGFLGRRMFLPLAGGAASSGEVEVYGNSPILFEIVITAYVIFAFAVVIITLFQLLDSGYYKDLLGNRGYLKFSLPASTAEHLGAKTLNAAIWCVLGTLVAILAVFALLLPTGAGLTNFTKVSVQMFGSHEMRIAIGVIVKVLVLMILGMVAFVSKAFVSITVGHQWQQHPLLGGVLVYIALSTVEGIVLNLLGVGTINVMSASRASAIMDSMTLFNHTVLILGAIQVALIAVYSVINWYLLDRKLDLH